MTHDVKARARELRDHIESLRQSAAGRREVAAGMLNLDGTRAQIIEAERLDRLADAIEAALSEKQVSPSVSDVRREAFEEAAAVVAEHLCRQEALNKPGNRGTAYLTAALEAIRRLEGNRT